ncbi:S8 family peptidase [Litoribacter alkaliphilus]|uniref:S8 family peptidase n=1 Tax=Litoribacter ruber TaxID=702568 RepID=A0AAP2G244_9BACT|nr:S8 family peptidase [Litoribacter alkaliphilus]MBS9525187.1 S8 family peptidase [Litoribacter alkaliphilus]
MVNFRVKAVVAFAIAGMIFSSCQNENMDDFASEAKVDETLIPGQYIVVLKETGLKTIQNWGARKDEDRNARLKGYDELQEALRKEVLEGFRLKPEQVDHVFGSALAGFSARLSPDELADLEKDDRVEFIEQDQIYYLEDFKMPNMFVNSILLQSGGSGQTTPWGITEIGGAVNASGLNRWAFVIDSGIQLNHPDLNVNSQYGRSFVSGYSSPTDQNGHGTHVAGTIAAIHNTIGVIGVAAGATVVPVRVFGPTGGSATSTIVSGIDYTTQVALANDVANLSLGGPASTALDNAVRNLAAKGVFCAIAAGNESQNANNVSPARATGTRLYTISAYDINGRFASFSNFGNPPIVVSAPGVNIYSTWIGSGYRAINGTSMATPHVAGILLANNGTVRWSGYVTNDPDGNPDRKARR